jgi:hypothetical protein
MTLEIVRAKIQKIAIKKPKQTAKRGTDKGETDGEKRRIYATLGTYTEFSDGWIIRGPDGRMHKGTGTVVRFNYRHGTWSVQRPQRCETNVMGYVFTQQGQPCWLIPERESGFTTSEFRRSFSPSFVTLCIEGYALAQVRPERKSQKTEKNMRRRLDFTRPELDDVAMKPKALACRVATAAASPPLAKTA